MRANLLQHARLVAQAVNVTRVQALTGTETDLNSPHYLRIKEQLAAVRATIPQCRFLYLLGRKADGSVFFFVDSEPEDSQDYSPPGQVYDEAPIRCRRVFDTKAAIVERPLADRWGVWVSALAPLSDPRTGAVVAVLGMDIDAWAWNWDVTSRAALPVALTLAVLVAVTAVFAAGRRAGRYARPIPRLRLLALVTTLVLLLAGVGTLLRQQYQGWPTKEIIREIPAVSGNSGTLPERQANTAASANFSPAQPAPSASTVRIGVLAHKGADTCTAMWQPTMDYLNNALPGRQFELAPLLFQEIDPAIQNKSIDFLICNPAIYVDMEVRYNITRILTLRNRVGSQVVSEFGGVVFCRADRNDLRCLRDARGQRIAATGRSSFGGWYMALREFRSAGIEPERDCAEVNFLDSHPAVVRAVLAGRADIGTVRTDTLERMASEGELRMGEIKVIPAAAATKTNASFPYVHSTRLYPEWPLAKLSETTNETASQLSVALLSMPDDSPAALAAQSGGWSVCLNYTKVHECLRELRVPPYEAYGRFGWLDVWRQYRPWLIAIAALIVALLGALVLLRRRQRALMAIGAQNRLLLKSAGEGICGIDKRGNATFINPAATRMLGFTSEELLGKNLHELTHHSKLGGELHPSHECPMYMACNDGTVHEGVDEVFYRKDGTAIPISFSSHPIVDAGIISGAVICFQDITGRKRTERALQQEQSFTEALLTSLPGIFYLYTYPELRLVRWNRNHETLLGFDEGEIEDRHALDWQPPETREAVRQAIDGVMEKGQAVIESPLLTKDGRSIPFLMTGIRFEVAGQAYLMGMGIDITERKRAELLIEKRIVALTQPMDDANIGFDDLFSLDEIQRIQDEFAQATGVASIITHPDGTPITTPSNFTRLCSEIIRKTEKGCANCHKSDSLIGRPHPDNPIVQPCLSGGLWDAGASIVVGERHIANWLIGQVRDEMQTEERMLAYAREIGADESAFLDAFREVPYMSRRRFELIANALFTLSSQLSTAAYHNVQQARFITEREKVENALRESEGRLKDIMFGMADWVWEVDANGVYTYCSEKSYDLFGLRPEEVIGKTPFDLMPTVQGEKIAALFADYVARKAPIVDLEKWCIAANSEPICLLTNGVPLLDEEGNLIGYRGVDKDITERRRAAEEKARLEGQLLQAQKMESVGQLAGGVAHDFNNMLGVILGCTELALEKLEPTHPLHADLTEVRKAAERSADLTRQLLAFARKQTVSPKILDLNEAVSGMLKMLQRLIGEDIDLLWLPGENLGPVKVDPSQMDQILANLCVNARDAIVDVGKITIATENCSFDEEYCAAHMGMEPGDYVRLSVSDDGGGMSQETLSHLFEPFFTTKGVGKGTGLGLATVYGAIKQNNGYIKVYSEPEQGTTFTILLPCYRGKGEQPPALPAADRVGVNSATVLLVEDEPSILNMCKIMLERLGLRVVCAVTPGEAIRLAQAHPGDIHLLMTDVVMPEMNGRELAKNLLSIYPDIKRLFMSGYTADVIAHHGVLEDGVHFIQKPFSVDKLTAKILEVMNSDRATIQL